MSISRRGFVQGSLATAAAGVPLAAASRRVRGANDEIRVAVCGVRSRGRTHINWAEGVDGVSVVALCDPDKKVLANRAKWVQKNYDKKVEQVTDYRSLLERDDIDVIAVATPNHLHSLIAIEAAEAGKDVYCEKPVSHNVWEGRQIVNAARKNNVIIQTGTQIRSSTGVQDMVKYARSGELGKIQYVIGTCYKARPSIGQRSSPLQIPDHIDYDLWCGPAAKVDLYRPDLHYDWHWDYNTGNGDLGNQGIHQMDIARWFLGEDALSPRVMSVGARLGYEDAANTPNTQIVFHDYPEAPLIFEVRGLPKNKSFRNGKGGGWNNAQMDSYRGSGGIGVVVQCEGGYLAVTSYGGGRVYDNNNELIKSFNGGGAHMENFIEAVRSRDRSILTAEIEEGHLSSALCHTGNISYLLGQKKSAQEIMERVQYNPRMSESYGRMITHLAANGIDLTEPNLNVGPMLEMNPDSERFTGEHSGEANQLLKRDYREPFVVPDLSSATAAAG